MEILDYACSECGVGINHGQEIWNRKRTKVYCRECAPQSTQTKVPPVDTYYANIYLGLMEGYNGAVHSIEEVYQVMQEYCNRVGFAVTVTETMFIYKDGRERGAIVGLINYPRFPTTEDKLEKSAFEIASLLKDTFRQVRMSIVFPDKTIMLGDK